MSPSASWLVTLAVRVSFVPGEAGVIDTESTTGAVFDALTVQVNVSWSLALPSLTDTSTLCEPTAPAVGVPLMTPVDGSIETPAGRPVAP